ncbi:MAG: TolC family protein [Candidatus Omnitrophota bacterium]
MFWIKRARWFLVFAGLAFMCTPATLEGETHPQGREPSQIIFLSLEEVSRMALEGSLDIQIAKFDADAKRTDILGAVSIYDTLLTAKASYQNTQFKQNSAFAGTKSVTNQYSLGVSKQLPTGTVVDLDFQDARDFSNSAYSNINPAHESLAKVSLTQPLGKNFFGLVDRNEIKITKLDIENSDYSSLTKIEEALADAQKAYWKVVWLTEELQIKRGMLDKAQELFDIYRKKRTIGLIEDPDLLAAEANVVLRQNDVLSAVDEVNSAKENLLLLLNEDSHNVHVKPLERLEYRQMHIDFYDVLSNAIEHRRDYRQAKNEIKMKKLSLVSKKNSLWPEIDLEASFARNGLSRQYNESWKQITKEDNPELFAAVTVTFPLENSKARGEFRKAKIERAKALVELKKTERLILTKINELITKVKILSDKVMTSRRNSWLQERKLGAEELRFRFGRSSSDLLIRYQEDVLNAKLGLAKSLYDHELSLIDLKLAQDILLDEYWEGAL